MNEAPASAPLPRAATAALVAGWLVLVAAGFVALPVVLVAAAALVTAGVGAWLSMATRRWQGVLAAVALLYWFGRPVFDSRSAPPGGTGTFVTLVAFAVLVYGGWWVGRRSAQG